MPKSLFKLVKETIDGPKASRNSIIAFHDNSSVITGFPTRALVPSLPGVPCPHVVKELTYHPLLTAETHNFPSGIAPFPGAETGTGGRIRDVQATGRGAHVIAGVSAYCVGSLHIPGYDLPWEDKSYEYPSNMAKPLQIEIEASNGASDYGNKFGEPVICGFTRSFGMTLPGGERREWIKPIMFTAGAPPPPPPPPALRCACRAPRCAPRALPARPTRAQLPAVCPPAGARALGCAVLCAGGCTRRPQLPAHPRAHPAALGLRPAACAHSRHLPHRRADHGPAAPPQASASWTTSTR